MKTETEMHTPTPWEVGSEEKEGTHIWSPGREEHVCTVDGQGNEIAANAAFIVRAANVHKELLEAAKKYRQSIRQRTSGMEPLNPAAGRLDAAIFEAEKP